MYVKLSESELIRLAKVRDTEAFGEIYERNKVRIFRHCYYLVGRVKQVAEELTNETFLSAWKAIEKFQNRGLPLLNWLLRIAHNTAIQYLRRQKPSAPIDVDIEDKRKSPEEIVDSLGEAEHVRKAVLSLPWIQRQVIVWRFWEELSYEEVADLLGKSKETIRVIQSRALKSLRKILEEQEAKPNFTRQDLAGAI